MKKLLLILFPLLAFSYLATAQSAKDSLSVLKGRVLDTDNRPVAGALVENAGNTAERTTTDMNGNFSLQSQNSVKSIKIHYMGMQTVKKKAETDMTVHMRDNKGWWSNSPDRMRLFAMVEIAVAETKHITPAYGFMIGQVKEWGWYVKGVFNEEKSTSESINFDPNNVWVYSKVKPSYMAFTAGVVRRLWSPFHVYVGAGYQRRKVAWETSIYKDYVEYDDDSCDGGVAVDAGLMFHASHFSINAGVTYNQDCDFAIGAGIGIVF